MLLLYIFYVDHTFNTRFLMHVVLLLINFGGDRGFSEHMPGRKTYKPDPELTRVLRSSAMEHQQGQQQGQQAQ